MNGRKIIIGIENEDGKIIAKIPLSTEWSVETEKLSKDIFGTFINESMINLLHEQIIKAIDKRTVGELLKEIKK